MVRDPLYRAIEEALGGKLDPDLFERCAAELLRPAYPGLSPVRGGGDAGMDGSIPATDAPPIPLICTTAKDVIGNLTRSLESYIAEGGESRFAVSATSQALTPKRRRNLESRARDLGFTLLNVHAQDDFVGRLYQDPTWRKELLGLTGAPPALSALPRSRRPFSTQALIGREDDLEWLRAQEGDCLVTGQPGSGKTAILGSLALSAEGAFLNSEDRGEIADAIRQQKPERVFVDDAHRRLELLVELCALRAEIDANFFIVATCWPAESEGIQRSLGLGPEAVRDLPLLPRTQVAEIVNAVGIAGPEPLVAEILDQAAGLPGLAVTLAQLSIRIGTVDLARGDFLLDDVTATVRDLGGDRAVAILASFSVGGRSGFSLDDVAEALRLNPLEVWDTVTRIEAGGVVREISRGALSVEPPALREALVREVFFNGPRSLRIAELLDRVPSPAHTAETVIRSRGRGAEIPDQLIRDLLERCVPEDRWSGREKERAWLLYAYSGPEAVDWILDTYPDLIRIVARPALIHRPARIIPLLLSAAVDDDRELHPHPDHPLRLVQDWVKAGRPGTGDALLRRRDLLDSVRRWAAREDAVPRVVRKAVSIAFSPEYENTPGGRIDPRRIVFEMGHISAEEFRALHGWWPEAVAILEEIGLDEVRDVEQMIRQWAYPGMLHGEVADEVAVIATTGAARMIEDVARLGAGFPAVRAWAGRLANRAGLDVTLAADLDPVYEVLFPPEEYGDDWKARHERQHEEARELGATWASEAPAEVAARLVGYDREAERLGHSWPRLTSIAASALAEKADEPRAWIDALAAEDAAPDLLAPFLWRLLNEGCDEAEDVWHGLFDHERYRYLCMSHALSSAGTSEAMLERTLESLAGAERLVEGACLRDEIPVERVVRLLEHPNPQVSSAAAVGVWYAGEKGSKIPGELRLAWRTSMIRHGRTNHVLQKVFRNDPELAREWLLARCGEEVLSRLREGDLFDHAVSALDTTTRRELLETLDADFGPPGFFGTLVGTDPELFDVLLGRADLEQVHLEPLIGRPGSAWNQLAKRALDSGYSPEDLVPAVHGLGWSWSGNESTMWKGWAESFRVLEDNEDARLREVGRIGRERAESRAAAARERELQEEVYGFE